MKTKIKIYYVSLFLLLTGAMGVKAQITIGSSSEPHKSAILDLKSTTKGLLLPNVALNNADLTQFILEGDAYKGSAKGMLVYNITDDKVYFWNGAKWNLLSGTGGSTETPVVSVTGVSLKYTTMSLEAGSAGTLNAEINPSDATDKSVSWSSSNTSVATVSNGVINAKAVGSAIITVTTTDGNKTATCTINVSTPSTVVAAGLTFMVRNLGASMATPNPPAYDAGDDTNPYGSLNGGYFQWGRIADGHEIYSNVPCDETPATSSDYDDSSAGKGQIKEGNARYGKFIKGTSGSNWDWRTVQNDGLWDGLNTVDGGGPGNPCPSGFRVPTKTEWGSVNAAITASNRQAISSTREGMNVGTSNLFLPAAGGRYYGSGAFISVGSYGNYWSSTVDGTNVYGLYFYGSESSVLGHGRRANGISVRCIKKN